MYYNVNFLHKPGTYTGTRLDLSFWRKQKNVLVSEQILTIALKEKILMNQEKVILVVFILKDLKD